MEDESIQQKGNEMAARSNLTETKKMPYWFSVLVAIDQLGNTIAYGNPDNTISARVGYFASNEYKSKIKPYWKTLERIIDFTFEPVQGPGHCYNAWLAEADETDTQGSYIARIILSVFVALGCLVISFFVRLAVLINPRLRYHYGALRYDSWRQSRKFSVSQKVAQIEP
jgi:hypothetical protein